MIKERSFRKIVGGRNHSLKSAALQVELAAAERRGYEVVVFHTTGMGGRAMDDAARRIPVLDLS